jgi:hypothetical protein
MGTRQPDATITRAIRERSHDIASRRIWLPAVVYDALPYFYLTAGFLALFATLYVRDWYWVIPYYLLFAGACLHLGARIWRRRRREKLRP